MKVPLTSHQNDARNMNSWVCVTEAVCPSHQLGAMQGLEYYSLAQFTILCTLSCRPKDGLHNL